MEEERRLAYVGITRAMRDLYITYARQRNVFGRQSYGVRSRFLDEIPRELTDQPDRNAVGARPPGGRRPGRVVGDGRGRLGGGAEQLGRLGAASAAAAAVVATTARARSSASATTSSTPRSARASSPASSPAASSSCNFAGEGRERKLMADYAPIRKR